MLEGRTAVLPRLHEAEPGLAVREPELVRISWIRRLSRVCGSGGGRWLRICHEPDGNDAHRGSTRCRAQRRALLGVRNLARARHDHYCRARSQTVYDRTDSVLVAMLMHASLSACTFILGPERLTGWRSSPTASRLRRHG